MKNKSLLLSILTGLCVFVMMACAANNEQDKTQADTSVNTKTVNSADTAAVTPAEPGPVSTPFTIDDLIRSPMISSVVHVTTQPQRKNLKKLNTYSLQMWTVPLLLQ